MLFPSYYLSRKRVNFYKDVDEHDSMQNNIEDNECMEVNVCFFFQREEVNCYCRNVYYDICENNYLKPSLPFESTNTVDNRVCAF